MKKYFILSVLMSLGLSMDASVIQNSNTSKVGNNENIQEYTELQSLQPTYLTNITESSNFGSNWFLELKGGMSAFLGSPIGCGDMFDRMKPVIQVGLGKWFTPSVGGRIGFQGLQFKECKFCNNELPILPCGFHV